MGLAERFAPKPPRLCKVGQLLATLTPEDRALVQSALDGPGQNEGGYSTDYIAAQLTAEGHRVGSTTVRTHRDHGCTCPQ